MLPDNQVTGFRRRPWAGSAKLNHKTSHPFKYSQNKQGIESRFFFTSNLQGCVMILPVKCRKFI